MIAYLEGKLTHKEPAFVIIDIHGVGYQAKISLNTYIKLKDLERGKIHTFLHVKEDAHTLYGFFDLQEKAIFLSLISISGVGPGTALVITSSLSVADLKKAIVNGDVNTIQKIKGIGAKTAQRIIIELRDKIAKEGVISDADFIISPQNNTIRTEALTALTTLGIAKNVAEKSLDNILKNSPEGITLEELIKQALKRF